jgi:hypothetical protein
MFLASAVLPPNVYAEMVERQVPRGVTAAESVEVSYEAAKKHCQAKVAQIVKECVQINRKYSDPYFDLADRSICNSPLAADPEPDLDSRDTGSDDAPFQVVQGSVAAGRLEMFHRSYGARSSSSAMPGPWPPSVKRVGDIFENPQFFVDGANAKDIRQGCDGDCWFLSAITVMCTLEDTQHLVDRVCVARDEDVGVYGFVLYRDGEWTSVVIDDKLYLRKADYEDTDENTRSYWEDNRIRINSSDEYKKEFQTGSRALYYAQSTDPNETWVPLLEKAFAKAHGDYGAIEGGSVG